MSRTTITAFIGSARKQGLTYAATRQFLDNLESFGDVQTEIIFLSDFNVGVCRGCKLCFDRGEEHCPLKDDRDTLIAKLMNSDGVIFASPNYSFQVSAILKIFLDRLGFAFHRPQFHGRAFTSVIVQGIMGGNKLVKYLDFVGRGLGFNVVKGSCVTSLDPMTEKGRQKMKRILDRHARRFHERLLRPARPVPSILHLLAFRLARTSMKLMLNVESRDYTYYRDHGWFESDYYYPTRLSSVKRALGAVFDWVGVRLSAPRKHGVACT